MLGDAIAVLEIIAVLTPLVAILVVQISRSDELRRAVGEELLRSIASFLFVAGLLLLAATLSTFWWASHWVPTAPAMISIMFLVAALSSIIVVAIVFPLLLLAGSTEFPEQRSLSEVDTDTEGGTTGETLGGQATEPSKEGPETDSDGSTR